MPGEQAQQHHGQPPLADRPGDQLVHRADAGERLVGIHRLDRAPHRVDVLLGPPAVRTAKVRTGRRRRLAVRQIELQPILGVEPFLLGVAHHADDLDPLARRRVGRAGGRAEGEALADRVVVRPVAAHELLVDDGDLGAPARS